MRNESFSTRESELDYPCVEMRISQSPLWQKILRVEILSIEHLGQICEDVSSIEDEDD